MTVLLYAGGFIIGIVTGMAIMAALANNARERMIKIAGVAEMERRTNTYEITLPTSWVALVSDAGNGDPSEGIREIVRQYVASKLQSYMAKLV